MVCFETQTHPGVSAVRDGEGGRGREGRGRGEKEKGRHEKERKDRKSERERGSRMKEGYNRPESLGDVQCVTV